MCPTSKHADGARSAGGIAADAAVAGIAGIRADMTAER